MVRLKEQKGQTELRTIERLAPPQRAYVPLVQHLGKPCVAEVKAGDAVLRGQRIASVEAHVTSPVHAPISGKVAGIVDWPHPVSGRCKAVAIDSDGHDQAGPVLSKRRSAQEAARLSPDEIRTAVFDAGIVGMGGAGFPTHIKLTPPKPVDTLIINGAECEPFVTADDRLMLEKASEIAQGIAVLKACLGVKNVYCAIEDNKPEAIKALQALAGPFTVKVLAAEYPQGGEKQLIKGILGREVARGKLPFDCGVVVHNVATTYAVYEAVYLHKPLYERVVTVAGSILSRPSNLLVRIGTPIKELIDYCGVAAQPAKVVIGGPMMGIAQYTTDVPVIKTTNAVILMTEEEASQAQEIQCIRCGACIRACPVGLMPCMINLAAMKELWEETNRYGSADCIECGCCNFVCPANRTMVQSIRRAKMEQAR